jgi:hypothetical protein
MRPERQWAALQVRLRNENEMRDFYSHDSCGLDCFLHSNAYRYTACGIAHINSIGDRHTSSNADHDPNGNTFSNRKGDIHATANFYINFNSYTRFNRNTQVNRH